MADGSFQTAMNALKTGLDAVATLSGKPADDPNGPSGLQGGASLTASVSLDPNKPFDLNVEAQFSAVFDLDADALIANAASLLRKLADDLGLDQLEGIAAFAAKLDNVDELLKGNWQVGLNDVLAIARDLDNHLPASGLAMLGGLGDRLLNLHGALTGPEAQQILSWFEGVRKQLNDFEVYVQRVDDGEDPATLLLELLGSTLADILAIFNIAPIQRAISFLDAAPFNLLPQQIITDFTAQKPNVTAAFPALQAAVNDEEAFMNAAIAHHEAMLKMQDLMRQLVVGLEDLANLEILHPGALAKRLGALISDAVKVDVVDNRKIKDPFEKLFDTIDGALADFDFSQIRDDILGQFDELRKLLEGAKLDKVLPDLTDALDHVDDAVRTARDGIVDLQGDASKGIQDVRGHIRDFLAPIGSFDASDNFVYVFETDLRNVLDNGKQFIEGDPNNPDDNGIRGNLETWLDTAKGFFQGMETQLQPVADNVEQVKTDAIDAITTFKDFVAGLDMPTIMADLAKELETVIDKLTAVDFRQVTDPIVAELKVNGDKLGQINTDDLNDMLKAALSEALKVVVDIDLTATITNPLKDEMATVKALPALAIEELQRRYEEALAFLDELSPEQLLQVLFEAFNVITDALNQLDLTVVLAELDKLHQTYLQDPFNRLKPSALLEPLTGQVKELTAHFDALDAGTLLEPLQEKLDVLKQAVTSLDLTAPLDELEALSAPIKQQLADLRPSDAIQGLEDTFAQLEAALDKLKPSEIMAPAAQVAEKMTAFLETVQEDFIESLFNMFQEPLQLLERLNPEKLIDEITEKLDAVVSLLKTADPIGIYQQLKASHFDLRSSISSGGLEANLEFSAILDPEPMFGELVAMYKAALENLTGLKDQLTLASLQQTYDELHEGVMDLLPPYAKALMDPATFKKMMGLADPTRFLTELDARFDTLKNKILFIRPQDLGQELDQSYDALLAVVDSWTFGDLINDLKTKIQAIKDMIDGLRIDFLADDLNKALGDVRGMLQGLDPTRLFDELDGLHTSLAGIITDVKPSTLLADLLPVAQVVQDILNALNLEDELKQPLLDTWDLVLEQLADIDFRVLVEPVSERLDELEAELIASLRLVEGAFDDMLKAGQAALGGSGGASGTLSVSAGASI